MARGLTAGAATSDITPDTRQFLHGYPRAPRYGTGIHTRLLSSALLLDDGNTQLLWVANDVLQIGRETANRVRERIACETSIPPTHILITATHTHSAPKTVDMLADSADLVVPGVDTSYLAFMEDGMVRAALRAHGSARPAEIGLRVAHCDAIGANRHSLDGPSDPDVPVVVVRDAADGAYLAAMIVCSMHPTVLHEDSTLVSGDFPAVARKYLQEHVLGAACPVLCHTGPCGNLSPRYVVRSNSVAEAERLGYVLGEAVARAIVANRYSRSVALGCRCRLVDLPPRTQPSVAEAQSDLARAARHLAVLRESAADRREVRTAECDWFGAEEAITLARASKTGQLADVIASVMPAEITVMRVGPRSFVGWPGEVFVEFALLVKRHHTNCHIISLANGELQGYLTTREAVQKGWYEARNSVFSNPESGMLLAATTLDLLATER